MQHQPECSGDGKTRQRREDGHSGFSTQGCRHGHQEQTDERRQFCKNRLVRHRGETKPKVSQGGQERDLGHRRLAGQNEPTGFVGERQYK